MKNNKFKLISILFTITLFGFTTNISAMETNKENNTTIKATVSFSDEENNKNEDLNLYEPKNTKNIALSSINMYIVDAYNKIKITLNNLKNYIYTADMLNLIKQDYIKAKSTIEEKKKEYEKILKTDIEKHHKNNEEYINAELKLKEKIEEYKQNLKDKKLIDIEEYSKISESYIKIINEKFNTNDTCNIIAELSKAFEKTKNYIKILNEKLKNEDSDINELTNNIFKAIEKTKNLIMLFNDEFQNINEINESLINEISTTIKSAEKCIKIIDEKFKNYENENKKVEFETKFEEKDLEILKEEIKNSYDLNKKYFLNYIDSISKIKPIKELKENKSIFEKSCNETINLMKKYDDINRSCDMFNEIKEEIEDILESFLIFYYINNEHVFYSFLERLKKTNPEKSKIDKNFATKYISNKDILEKKFENSDKVPIPKIESLLNDIKINRFDLNNKFIREKKELEEIKDEEMPYEQIKKDYLNIINKNGDDLKKKNEIKQKLSEINQNLKNFLENDLLNINYLDISEKFLKDLKKQQSKFDEYLNKDLTKININLLEKILVGFKTINENIKKEIMSMPQNLKNFINQCNDTKKAFLQDMANIEIERDENSSNFEINKKFMSSLNQKKYSDLYKNLLSQYKKCNNIFNLIDYKKYNILKETKDEFNNMRNNYIKSFLTTCESELDISLKFAIDKFYENFKQENINKNKIDEDRMFSKDSKNSLDKFFEKYAKTKRNCYRLNEKIMAIDKKENFNDSMKEKKERLKNYTMLLRGYGENPFLNLLTQNKEVFNSLEFQTKMEDYKIKIKYYLNKIKDCIDFYIKDLFTSKLYKFLNFEKHIKKDYNFMKSNLFKALAQIINELKILTKEYSKYIYDTLKELIKNNKEKKIKIYNERILKEKFSLILELIKNIKEKLIKEEKGTNIPNLIYETKKIIEEINEYIKTTLTKVKKVGTADFPYEENKFSKLISKYNEHIKELLNLLTNNKNSETSLSFEEYLKEFEKL